MRHFHRSTFRHAVLLLLSLSCLVFLLPHRTQSQVVTITLRPPPPNTLRLSDLWEVTIVNALGQPLRNVHLVASVIDASTQAPMLTATTAAFNLTGATTTFSGRSGSLPPTTVNYQSATFREAIARTGNAPSGSYLVAVDLFPSDPAAGSLTGNNPGEFTANIQLVSAPLLLTPADGAEVSEKYPVFTWTMTSAGAARPSVEYAIRIVEVIGRQSPTAAMQSNPAWFEREKITTSTFLYPPSARPFNLKSRYAWKVSAVEGSGRAVGNIQRAAFLADSEVWEFTAAPSVLAVDANPKPVAPKKKKIDVLDELLRSCSGAGPGPVK